MHTEVKELQKYVQPLDTSLQIDLSVKFVAIYMLSLGVKISLTAKYAQPMKTSLEIDLLSFEWPDCSQEVLTRT